MGGNRELADRFIATLEARDWDGWTGLLHPAVVYEIPQSRERIRGRDRYLRFNQEYPGDWHLRPKVTIADERHGVVWFEWVLDGRADDGMAFFEFADGLITRVTDFWPEPYEPPPGREHLVERWLPAPPGNSLRSLRIGFSAEKAPPRPRPPAGSKNHRLAAAATGKTARRARTKKTARKQAGLPSKLRSLLIFEAVSRSFGPSRQKPGS